MFKNKINAVRSLVAAGALAAGSAFAAVPADVTTALTDAKADGISVAGLVLIAVIAMYAFKLMRRGI